LTDRVKNIFTLNEAGRFLNFGYGWALTRPVSNCRRPQTEPARPPRRLAHGLAVQAIRAKGARRDQGRPRGGISRPACRHSTHPKIFVQPRSRRARLNAGFLGVILEGDTPTGSGIAGAAVPNLLPTN